MHFPFTPHSALPIRGYSHGKDTNHSILGFPLYLSNLSQVLLQRKVKPKAIVCMRVFSLFSANQVSNYVIQG